MKIFIVTTSSTCISEYKVKAKNKKQAEEMFYEGNYEEAKELDYHDEIVLEVEEKMNNQ